MILKKIQKYLEDRIKIYSINIYDNSMLHSNYKSDITHLEIIIISNDFMNTNLIDRHRKIFSFLNDIILKKIYSITLHTYTVIEWNNKKKIYNLPKCLNNTRTKNKIQTFI